MPTAQLGNKKNDAARATSSSIMSSANRKAVRTGSVHL